MTIILIVDIHRGIFLGHRSAQSAERTLRSRQRLQCLGEFSSLAGLQIDRRTEFFEARIDQFYLVLSGGKRILLADAEVTRGADILTVYKDPARPGLTLVFRYAVSPCCAVRIPAADSSAMMPSPLQIKMSLMSLCLLAA